MAWSGGSLTRFTGIPDMSTSTTSSARLSGRHSQSLHNAVSRTAQSSVYQRAASITARGAQVAITAAASSSGDAKIQKVQAETNVQFSAVALPASPAFSSVSPTLQHLTVQHGSEVANPPASNTAQKKSEGASSRKHSSSRVVVEFSGLPPEVVKLGDPSANAQLPPPSQIYSRLDNRELDKLVSALGRNKAIWRRSLTLYNWLKDCGHSLDDRLCTTLIRVLAEHGAWSSAAGVYDWMKAPAEAGGAGLKPTVYTYTAAMRAALGANMLDVAMQIWKDAQAAGCQPDCRLCITYIEVCSRLGLVQPALEMYEHMKSSPTDSKMAPTVHAYTAAMRAATEGGLWQKALDIWSDMKQAMCAPTGHAYAAVISACAAGMDWMRAVSLFEEMCSSGIQPDVVSCTALITALAAAGRWQQAESVVQWMLRHGLRPNVRTYTALLTALGNAKQWERAVEMLQLMQQPAWGSVSPNAYTYSALLKSLGEHGLWKLAEQVFSHLEHEVSSSGRAHPSRATPPSPPSNDLQARSNGMLSASHAAVAPPPPPPPPAQPAMSPLLFAQPMQPTPETQPAWTQWTSPAQLNGLHLDSFHALHQAPAPRHVSQGLFDPLSIIPPPPPPPPPAPQAVNQVMSPANAVANTSASQPQSHGVHPMDSAVNMVHKGVARNSSSPAESNTSASTSPSSKVSASSDSTAVSVPHHGKPHNEPKIVNEVVCGALMLAYERAGKWDEAVRVLARARALGIEPNTVMYNTAISAAGKALQLDIAEQLFHEMQHPDAVTFETLIAAYGMAGLPAKAENILVAMMSVGFRPRDYAYCGLIAAYSMSGDLQNALNVRNRLFAQGGPLTVHVYNSLMAACERAGQWEQQLELYRVMQAEGLEPNHVTLQLVSSAGRRSRGAPSLNPMDALMSTLDPVLAAALSAYLSAAAGMLAPAS